jgi:ABC-type proline/glycine betaine transport systems, permease component
VFVIATATIAGIFAGGGLGDIMVRQVTYGLAGTFAAAIWVAGLALLTAAVLALTQRAASRRMAPKT